MDVGENCLDMAVSQINTYAILHSSKGKLTPERERGLEELVEQEWKEATTELWSLHLAHQMQVIKRVQLLNALQMKSHLPQWNQCTSSKKNGIIWLLLLHSP